MPAWITNGSIYDDFRAVTVGTDLNGRTSTSGHTWSTLQTGDGTWEVQSGTEYGGTVQGNVVGAVTGTRMHAGIDFGSADCDVETTLERPVELTTAAGLMVRRVVIGSDDGYYYVSLFGGTVTIAQRDPFDVITDLGSWSGLTVPSLSVLRAVCSGSSISAYLNGVLLGSVTDSTYSGTTHGLWQRFSGATNSYRFYTFNMHPPPRTGILVGSIAV